MNITYLIGNGFDLNLGLKTSYSDFYDYYRIIKPSNPLRDKLLKKIEDDTKDYWKDLETKLGEYTKEFENPDDFIMLYGDINSKLKEYIKKNEEYLLNTKIDNIEDCKNNLFYNLIHPEFYFSNNQKAKINSFIRSNINSENFVNVISFNYTKSLEKFTNEENNIKLGNIYNYKVTLSSINHIHSILDNNIILGVNDISQIANEKFRDNLDITDFLVKPEANNMFGSGIDNDCKQIISTSNLICLYGISLGDTDKIWWEKVGQRFNDKSSIILYFVYDKEYEDSKKDNNLGDFRIGNCRRKHCRELLEKMGYDPEQYKKFIDKSIFVCVNSDMFNIDLPLNNIDIINRTKEMNNLGENLKDLNIPDSRETINKINSYMRHQVTTR